MVPVDQLLSLLARNFDVPRIRYDDIVTTVRYETQSLVSRKNSNGNSCKLTSGVKYRLVLAHEDYSDPLSKLSEDTIRGVDMVPYAGVGQRSLYV